MPAVKLFPGDYIVLAGYLIGVILIGIWFSRKENTSEDFLLGSRKIPWLAVGISFLMSLLSTYSLVMVPGEIYSNGLSIWILQLAFPFFMLLAFYMFTRFYFKLKSFTPFEYLEKRYGTDIRIMISSLFLLTRILYLAMVLYTSAKVFEGGADWAPWCSISVVGIIGIIYTVMGGRKAVVWADVLQFFILVFGLGMVVYVCIQKIDGGFWNVLNYSFSHGRGPEHFTEPEFYSFNPYVRLCFWLIIISDISQALFYASADQISVQMLLSTSSYKSAKKSMLTYMILSWPFKFTLWFIGLAIFTFYAQHPDSRVSSGDTALFTFISTQLPTPIPGVFFAALMAAAMSTLNAGMNSLSTVILKEYYIKYINQNASEKRQVHLSRVFTVVVGLFAMGFGIIIAVTSETLQQSVLEALTIFGGFSVVIVPAFLFAVLSTRATGRMIWFLSSLSWGVSFGMVAWYMASRKSYSGSIDTVWMVIPAATFIMMLGIAMAMRLRQHKYANIPAIASLLPLGFCGSAVFWYFTSHAGGGGQLSFQWVGVPPMIVFLVVGFIWVRFFGTRQTDRKHIGLTLWSSGKDMIQD